MNSQRWSLILLSFLFPNFAGRFSRADAPAATSGHPVISKDSFTIAVLPDTGPLDHRGCLQTAH